MSLKQTQSRAGFSLVELMVVVAIIGILATIAVPNFQRFQAKALQSNAKVELSAAFTAEKAFYAEYATYHANFPAIGFVPEGFNILADGTPGTPSTRRYYSVYSLGADKPVALNTLSLGLKDGWTGFYPATATICLGPSAGGPNGGNADVQQTTFILKAQGCPLNVNQSGASLDQWTINESKNLINEQSGI